VLAIVKRPETRVQITVTPYFKFLIIFLFLMRNWDPEEYKRLVERKKDPHLREMMKIGYRS
jgi:hypothetical protein